MAAQKYMNKNEKTLIKFLFPLFKILAIVLMANFAVRLLRKFYKFPAPAFTGYFLGSGFRKMMQPPEKVIDRSGIKAGFQVVEVGCGSGTFTIPASKRVGAEGKVYAVDIQEGMLEQLKRKLARPENEEIKNIDIIKADAVNLPFLKNSMDAVFMVTVLQEIPDPLKALKETYRILKPGGVLAVTEFLPDPDYPLQKTTVRLGENAGFVFDRTYGNIWNYTARFIKAA